MSNIASLVTSFKKTYGDTVASHGLVLEDAPRIPTGIFELDLATGGGIPRGCLSIIFGPESSGKTNIVLKTIAMHQKIYPHLTCVFIDIENSFDPVWASILGVDVDNLVVLHPDFAEQAVDMIEGLLESEDCGLIALDSVAAMITIAEQKKSAEDAIMGGSGAVMGRLSHKSLFAMRRAKKDGRCPTLIYINQNRFKVGFVMGNPETMPGGGAQKFQAQMIVRVAGKNVLDNKVSKVMPVIKQTSFSITKWKVPITATHGIFSMAALAHDGHQQGSILDYTTLMGCLKGYELMTKVKGGWSIEGLDDVFPNGAAVTGALRDNTAWADTLRKTVIERAISAGISAPQIEEEE